MLGIAAPLLDWFAAHRRILPFREDPTPYHIWISEIMLQQTRMQTVLPQEERWRARWMICALQLPISADGAESLL